MSKENLSSEKYARFEIYILPYLACCVQIVRAFHKYQLYTPQPRYHNVVNGPNGLQADTSSCDVYCAKYVFIYFNLCEQSPELVDYLLSQGADVNAEDVQRKTALHYAVQAGGDLKRTV